MFTGTTGWAQQSSDGSILHTTQGVGDWSVATPPLPPAQAIVAVAYVDADTARLLAAGGLSSDPDAVPVTVTFTSWATGDGGARWTQGGSFSVEQDPGLSWQGDLDYVNGDDGWFSANQDDTDTSLGTTLFRTVDGGADWQEVADLASPPASPPGTCFTEPTATFATPTTVWLTGGGCVTAQFEVSHDGGATWAPQTFPLIGTPYLSVGTPVFISSEVGVMLAFSGGGGGPVLVYLTADGGQSWTEHAAPGEVPHAVDFIGADDGWLLSSNTMNPGFPAGLYVTHDGGQTWTTLQPLDNGPAPGGIDFNGSILDFVSPTRGWTDTFNGSVDELLQTSDGGGTWTPVDVQVSGAADTLGGPSIGE